MDRRMKSLELASKKSKERQCIVLYASLGPYSELKDVNEKIKARIRAKQGDKLLRAEIIVCSNACLYLMAYKKQHTEFI